MSQKLKSFAAVKSHAATFQNFADAASGVVVWFSDYQGSPCITLAFKAPDQGGIRNIRTETTVVSKDVTKAIEKWAESKLPELRELIATTASDSVRLSAIDAAPDAIALLAMLNPQPTA